MFHRDALARVSGSTCRVGEPTVNTAKIEMAGGVMSDCRSAGSEQIACVELEPLPCRDGYVYVLSAADSTSGVRFKDILAGPRNSTARSSMTSPAVHDNDDVLRPMVKAELLKQRHGLSRYRRAETGPTIGPVHTESQAATIAVSPLIARDAFTEIDHQSPGASTLPQHLVSMTRTPPVPARPRCSVSTTRRFSSD